MSTQVEGRRCGVPRTVELVTPTAEATRAAAAAVASILVPGDVVSLTGELGAGKTCFAQGAAAALGVEGPVTSPTFLLRRDYEGARCTVTHFDVYRLERLSEVVDVGFGETDGVVLVEWGDAMRPLLPSDHLEVELVLDDPAAPSEGGDEPRRLRLVAHGDSWQRRLSELEPDLEPWRSEAST